MRNSVSTLTVTAVLIAGLAACGSQGTTTASQTSTTPAKSAAPTTSYTDGSAAMTGLATSVVPKPSLPTVDGKLTAAEIDVLNDLYAFDNQLKELTVVATQKATSATLGAAATRLQDHAGGRAKTLADIVKAAGGTPGSTKPEGLLSADQMAQVGTPDGAEFDMAWRTLAKRQREAALKRATEATVTNAKAKEIVKTCAEAYKVELEAVS